MTELAAASGATYAFRVPTRMEYGIGVAGRVGQVAQELGGHKAFLITDEGLASAGLADRIAGHLASAGIAVELFCTPSGEPTDKLIGRGTDRFSAFAGDIVVGLGGGSSLDTAKAVRVMATNAGSILDYEGMGRVEGNTIPLIALPSTAGTGSESNGFSVVIDSARDMKTFVYAEHMAPQVALVDPLLTLTVPPHITAYTGIDALAQAIAAYTAKLSQPAADALALHAIELLYANLARAVARGDDLEARTNMALGSMISGLAMLNSDCTAEHTLAETLGAHCRLHHGLTVAILLPHVMEFNRLALPDKFARLARAMGENFGALSVRDAARATVVAVSRLLDDLRIPTLREAGVGEEELPILTDKAMSHVGMEISSNPRQMTRQDVLRLYQQAYRDPPRAGAA